MKIDEGHFERLGAPMLSIIVIDVMGNYFCPFTSYTKTMFNKICLSNNPRTHASYMCVLLQKRPQRSCVILYEMYLLPSC